MAEFFNWCVNCFRHGTLAVRAWYGNRGRSSTTLKGIALSTERLKTMKLLIEIRAAEGGADAKLLVRDQFAIYANAARLHRL